ncbi:bifunctional indole-3-glycerol phosphate synthase/phosphoribosylanthranilate isomerase [Fibrobacter sp.]|uniref:bifunctional indole-3-glycerol phosphate synthase/phosphoribosylanthranilate isomerase n=1 Tax=Fibrobacter sp. TaxID=35828 RepID=UPI0025BF6F22|nr:bifunctional indole-3-glycerol phosphate synthase/phosphoribosylanthranilate isomerase [Fibrobacter sp.]MBS7273418.1 bifunctional indole-3-glycerol phosphate synthase/phosphoribosylanthranilate isomerase [Fibrobacter sp.]MDD7498088.1 bifunctional indole-3-glycerol phosphate synthase/phosphoribosylanthranilate isomerase [Fibrobacter sp.]MDY5724859.1 bifunctional indole-3-glycerol phosphate synthase/phosphoribosylanthranilate isomerase [Fibrobacter sp.]
MSDILQTIVEKRRADIERLGLNFGIEIPEKRRVGHTEFLGNAGAILEVKRASPSKGDIAPDLDPVGLATIYAEAHAQAVSVLTEGNFFKGSLRDLIAVADLMEKRRQQGLHACAVLRKDFLLYEDEIDVAFRCGADAVLLIARILDDEQLVRMAKRAQSFDIQAFVEVREKDDFRKLSVVTSALGADAAKTIVAGVNSRDLATFRTDPLIPASVRSKLPAKAVFESGVHTPADADYARSLGFTGILVGEAVAKNPALAKDVVSAFESGRENARGYFWKKFAALWQAQRTNQGPFKVGGVRQAHQPFAEPLHRNRPLVKICGITRVEDGMLAAELGADMLGFVFSTTKRLTTEEFVKSFSTKLRAGGNPVPLLVGVITDPESPEGKTAIKLVREGVLDAVQLHGIEPTKCLELADDKVPELVEGTNKIGIPYYCAARIGEESDFDKVAALRAKGEPRILLDAKVEGIPGGTGKTIPENLLREKAGDIPLWLAGGITPTNVAELVGKFSPELIDVSSGVEDAPGIKNSEKLKALFAAFTSH